MTETLVILSKYKEFITNGLDLLSFLLISPQLIKLAAPTAKLVFWLIYSILIVAGLLLMQYVANALGRILDLLGLYAIFPLLVLLGLWGTGALLMSAPTQGQRYGEWLARHAFFAGALLFLISRMFAFMMAAYGTVNEVR